jgi:hypothetical protein
LDFLPLFEHSAILFESNLGDAGQGGPICFLFSFSASGVRLLVASKTLGLLVDSVMDDEDAKELVAEDSELYQCQLHSVCSHCQHIHS